MRCGDLPPWTAGVPVGTYPGRAHDEMLAPDGAVHEGWADLAALLDRDFRYVAGSSTLSSTVPELFTRGAGVCQDFAHLAVACLAARYVSGYLETTPPPGRPRIVGADASHAWVSACTGVGCALTRTRPADADAAAMGAFADTEAAKGRLVYQLDDLGLPTDRVVFDLLSSAEEPVTTDHADGVVTIDMAEGDDAHRESLRIQLDEPYRTMLGQETGHWYWTVLVEPDPDRFARSSMSPPMPRPNAPVPNATAANAVTAAAGISPAFGIPSMSTEKPKLPTESGVPTPASGT